MMDGFDMWLFLLALPLVIKYFNLSHAAAGFLSTTTLFVAAFGGVLAGIVADYIGRVKMLTLTILLYSIFTGLTGVANSYSSLVVYRAIEGLGFGGAWTVCAALVAESAPSEKRGLWGGFMQSAWPAGWGLALIVQLTVVSVLQTADNWRVLFWIGALPAIVAVTLIRKVKEPEIWLETVRMKKELRARQQTADVGEQRESLKFTVFQLWAKNLRKRTVLGFLLCTGNVFGYYAIFSFLPIFLKENLHLTIVGSGPYLALVISGSLAGGLTSGWLNDVLGRRKNILFWAVGAIIIVFLYTRVIHSNNVLLAASFLLGAFATGIMSGFSTYLGELFPSSARGTALGVLYNGARAVGAFGPLVVGTFSAKMGGLGGAIAFLGMAAYSLCIIAALLLPETKGMKLRALH
jgi:MFS family permease